MAYDTRLPCYNVWMVLPSVLPESMRLRQSLHVLSFLKLSERPSRKLLALHRSFLTQNLFSKRILHALHACFTHFHCPLLFEKTRLILCEFLHPNHFYSSRCITLTRYHTCISLAAVAARKRCSMNTPIGWKAWNGHAKLANEPDSTLAARVRRVLDNTNWHALCLRLTELFHSRCQVTIEFTYGGSGLVKLAVLDDTRCFIIWLAHGTDSIQKMERRTWASCFIRSLYITLVSFSSMFG